MHSAQEIDAIRFTLDRQADLRVPYGQADRVKATNFVRRLLEDQLEWGTSRPAQLSQRQPLGDGGAASEHIAIGSDVSDDEELPLVDSNTAHHRTPVFVVRLLLGHTARSRQWRTANGLVSAPSVACALELLLAIGLDADGYSPPMYAAEHPSDAHAPDYSLLHLLASGGCDPHTWEDKPEPLPAPLQHRLIRWSVRLGAHIELRDAAHWATPLSWSCWFGCRPGAAAMLGVTANRDALDRYGSTSRTLALERARFDLDDLLDSASPTLEDCEELPPPNPRQGGGDPTIVELRRERVAGSRAALRNVHAGWAEEQARIDAALGARWAARACDVALDGVMLPGPAMQAVADALLITGCAKLWPPVTRAVVDEVN